MNNNLSEEFVNFIRSCFGSEEGSWEDIEYDAYELIRKDKPFKDRLQYLKTEYLQDSPPNEGGIDYRLIFKDMEDPHGAHYAFTCCMNSWYSWEEGNILCELRRWKKVEAKEKVVTVYE